MFRYSQADPFRPGRAVPKGVVGPVLSEPPFLGDIKAGPGSSLVRNTGRAQGGQPLGGGVETKPAISHRKNWTVCSRGQGGSVLSQFWLSNRPLGVGRQQMIRKHLNATRPRR